MKTIGKIGGRTGMVSDTGRVQRPQVTITFCTQCNWLLRSAWMAQELLSTFANELGAVTLVPATGGAFRITLDDEAIWERVRDGGFPDIRVLKQMVRDRIAPDRSLGHTDTAAAAQDPA